MVWFGRPSQPVYVAIGAWQAEACARLHAACFAQGWTALDFERLIGSATSFGDAALASRSGALAGFVLSRGAAGEAEILTVAVDRAWRRRGVGRALIDRHCARLSAAGMVALFLEVDQDNVAARTLYAATGFVEVGQRKGYYSPIAGRPAASALVLRRDLG